MRRGKSAVRVAAVVLAAAMQTGPGRAAEAVPTGQTVTPKAARGAIFQPLDPGLPDAPGYLAGQAAATALSPDGRTLLILTSGYNRFYGADGAPIPGRSNEYVFVYDVAGPAPVKRQALQVENTYLGLAWAPRGGRFYVSGGVDDRVIEFAAGPAGYDRGRVFPLGHKVGLGLAVKPQAAGLAVSPDGSRLIVANHQNDSVSLIDLATGAVRELDLRPAAAGPAGRFLARSPGPRRHAPSSPSSGTARSSPSTSAGRRPGSPAGSGPAASRPRSSPTAREPGSTRRSTTATPRR